MKMSPGAVALVRIAYFETMLSRCAEVAPEHLFAAFCKAGDVSSEELAHLLEGSDVAPSDAEDELSEIIRQLGDAGLDGRTVRRRLRNILSRQPGMEGTFSGHRSQPCRDLFRQAAVRSEVMAHRRFSRSTFSGRC